MIDPVTKEDYPQLVEVWESAVKNTHDFLTAEDFEFYKSQITYYFDRLKLYACRNEREEITGFLGMDGCKVEMLFIDNVFRGTGIGRKLLEFAFDKLNADKLDVNEQNKQAIGFYKHLGFICVGRSEVDGEGKDYPLLHMERSNSYKEKSIKQNINCMKTFEKQVEGISCPHCVATITKAVSALPGVTNVKVDMVSKIVTADYDEPTTEAEISVTIEDAGYTVIN